MRKIFILLAFILLISAGCGNNAGATVSPSTSVTPEPTVSINVTPQSTVSITAEPSAIVSSTPKPAVENYKLDKDSILLSSGIKISDLQNYFTMKRNELIPKLGNKYELVDSGAEGTNQGYYYKEKGITLVFNDIDYSFEQSPLIWVECDADKLDLNGLTPDMNFSQIQERIGKGEITKDKIEEIIWQHDYWYTMTYKIGHILLEFRSFSEDGSDRYWVIAEHSK